MKIVQYDLLIARSVCVMEAKDKIRIRKEPCLKKVPLIIEKAMTEANGLNRLISADHKWEES